MADQPTFLRSDAMPAPAGAWLQATNAVWPSAIAGGVFIALGVGAVVAAVVQQAPWWGYALATVWGGVMALIGWAFWGAFQAALKPSNWLLRADETGLFLKIRSFRNHAIVSDQPDVLFLPRGTVAWLRPRRRLVQRPDSEGGSYRQRQQELEIKLADDAWIKPIRAQIHTERGLWATHGRFGRSRHGHYPVAARDGVVRVTWRGHADSVRPPLQRVLAELARWYPVEGEATAATEAHPEQRILELAEAGDTLAAVKLAREHYGLGLKDAKDFVDQLRGR